MNKKNVINGFAIILLMQSLGELLSRGLNFPLPGNLLGLVLLFLALFTGIIKLEWVEETASLLLDNLMLLFVPLNVGIMTIFPLLKKEWLAIVTGVIVSTILVMVVTAKTVDFFVQKKGGGMEDVN